MDRHSPHSTPDFRKGDSDAEREELERLAPTLFGIPQDEPFKVPAHFFDRLPHEVQAKVVDQRKKPADFSWFWRLAIAAPVAAVLFGAWWFTREPSPNGDPEVAATTTEAAPTIDDLEGVEEDDLLAAMDGPEDLGTVAVDPDLTDDELLDYLEQQSTDLDELISEL